MHALPADFHLPEADVSHISRKRLDIPYAHTSARQKLDVYLPESGGGPFPVVMNIHGGAFAMGNKRDIRLVPMLQGLPRGYAVVSVDYRLSGEAVFPAGVQDVKAAVRWLRARGHEYRLDPERMAVWGNSSGANFAAMLAVTGNQALFDDPALGDPGHPGHVEAAVDWFGPMDFLAMDRQLAENGLGPCDHGGPDSPESRYLGAQIALVPDRVRLANPITFVGPGMAPILIQHGRIDPVVPFQQSVQLAEAIEARVGRGWCELDILDEAGHNDPLFETEENLDRIFAFLERRLS
jgi:acetyl esterase/lipase